MKKTANTGIIITGLLLIAAALLLTLYNFYDDFRAQQSAAQTVTQLGSRIPEPTEPTAAVLQSEETEEAIPEMPEENINGRYYIGALEIPVLDLTLPVISQWSYPSLKAAPCRYQGSAYTDDLVISAHNYPSHFGRLVELVPGDTVAFTDMNGTVFRYQVTGSESLEATDITEMCTGDWDLTLFTCTVGGVYRVAIRCDRIREEQPVVSLAVPETNDGLGSSVSEKRGEAPAETEPAEELDIISIQTAPGWDHVPLYFQTDYPYTMYGSGTIESSGCSITSLAMVASYLTEHENLPDELARYFGGRAENNIARLETGSETLQLPFSKAPNWNHTYAALKEGKTAIVLMGPSSIFTDSQHFIVLTGMTEDGRILVNDPYRPIMTTGSCAMDMPTASCPERSSAATAAAGFMTRQPCRRMCIILPPLPPMTMSGVRSAAMSSAMPLINAKIPWDHSTGFFCVSKNLRLGKSCKKT